jgi:hypothetical protein
LHRVPNPVHRSRFLYSALPSVAPYCVPGGVKVVSEVRGLHVAGSCPLSKRVGMGRAYPQPFEFTLHDTMRWAVVSRCRTRAATFMILPTSGCSSKARGPSSCLQACLPPRKIARTSPTRLANPYPVHPSPTSLCHCKVGLYGDERVSGEGSSPLARAR